MAQEICKVCPHCGTKNAANAIECVECDYPLITVQPRPIEDLPPVDPPPVSPPAPDNMVRICEECGFHNPVNARKCKSCGEDISDITPVPEIGSVDQSKFILASLDGEEAFQVTEESTMIGRTEKLKEYLEGKSYVSRRHAMIYLRDGKMFVQNLSKTNPTFVNNVRISDTDEIELHDGDELALGGNEQNGSRQDQAAYFQVRIGSCS